MATRKTCNMLLIGGLLLVQACAVVQIERDGEVVERRLEIVTSTARRAGEANGTVVVKLSALGLWHTNESFSLGWRSEWALHVPDTLRCNLIAIVDSTTASREQVVAELAALIPKGCALSVN